MEKKLEMAFFPTAARRGELEKQHVYKIAITGTQVEK